MWEKLQASGGKGFFTVLTQEFLWEDMLTAREHVLDEDGVSGNSYNVPFHNAKQEGLHNQKEIIVTRLGGKLEQFCQ